MSYRISYDDTLPLSIKKWRDQERAYTETFETEHEALNRARQLLDDADVGALTGEPRRDGFSDPLAAPSDDGHPSIQDHVSYPTLRAATPGR